MSGADIRKGVLSVDTVACVVVGGGGQSWYMKELGTLGREMIRLYVIHGGGYVGVSQMVLRHCNRCHDNIKRQNSNLLTHHHSPPHHGARLHGRSARERTLVVPAARETANDG